MTDKSSQDWDSAAKARAGMEIAEYVKDVNDKIPEVTKNGRSKAKNEPVARALLALGGEVPLRSPTGASAPPEDGGPAGPSHFFGVEEAVMRYVGGTLQEDRASKKHKPVGHYDNDFNEYIGTGSWEKFLREEITGDPDGNDANPEEYSTIFDQSSALHPGTNIAATSRPDHPAPGDPHQHHRKKRHLDDPAAVDAQLSHIGDNGVSTHALDQAIFQAQTQGLNLGGTAPREPRKSKPLEHKQPRIAWTGDGTETGGIFDEAESRALNDFLERFMVQNNLTRQQLCERVWAAERKKDNFWDAVSAVLPHRTRASVYKHVRRVYHVFTVRGKWSPSEDLQLGQLVNERGAQWKSIGIAMHRMPEDCRDRWRNYVKCGGHRNQNKWSVKEESQLQRVVTQMLAQNPSAPVNWTLVSEQMGCTRSRIQCRYKWKKMTRKVQEEV